MEVYHEMDNKKEIVGEGSGSWKIIWIRVQFIKIRNLEQDPVRPERFGSGIEPGQSETY